MSIEGTSRNFGFAEDEQMLRDVARKFLDENFPVQKLRDLVAADSDAVYERGERPRWDEVQWKQMVELGWTGLAVPEASGGSAFKLVGIVGLAEQLGQHAVPSPLIPTVNATHVLNQSQDDRANAWLAKIADGSSATLAITDATGSWESSACDVVATKEAGNLRLDGNAYFVQDAFKADWLLTAARHDEQVLLCMVAADAAGVELVQNHIHDLTRDQATVSFEGVEISTDAIVSLNATQTLAAAWPAVLVTVAADLVGCAEWQLQTTAEYAKNRKQFDRQLGFFQAVKHPLVNAMMEIDRARSLVYHAACCFDEKSSDSDTAARMAKSAASDAGAFISDRSVQLHGGIGFTWECDVHLYFKRSLHNQALYGDGAYQRSRLADTLIGPVSD